MDTLPIITRSYELYKLIIDINDHLGKRHRYALGQSLEETVLGLLQELIFAKNAPKPSKSIYLLKASTLNEVAVLKLRLYLELKIANETKVFQTQNMLREIGRMTGGWLKSL